MTNTGAYRIPMGINLAFIVILALGVIFIIPESPRWLISKNKNGEALAALHRVHKGQSDEDAQVEEQYDTYMKAKQEEAELTNSEPSRWRDLLKGTTRRKFICAVGILISQQIGGVQFIFSYTTTFLGNVGVGSPFIITIIVVRVLHHTCDSAI